MANTSTTEDVPFVTQLALPARTHKLVLPAQSTHTSKELSVLKTVESDNSPTTRPDPATHAPQPVLPVSEPLLLPATLAPPANSSTRTNV